jgi:hypothetical protein
VGYTEAARKVRTRIRYGSAREARFPLEGVMVRARIVTGVGVWSVAATLGGMVLLAQSQGSDPELTPPEQLSRRTTSTMANPFRMVENWPTLSMATENCTLLATENCTLRGNTSLADPTFSR